MTDPERTGRRLQQATIVWNLAEVVVTVSLGLAAGSLALIAFGLDSLIEVFASLVVLWHMAEDGRGGQRDDRARRLVAIAFAVLAAYLIVASGRALWMGTEPEESPIGIAYLAVTALVMFGLAAWKRRVGREIGSETFLAEAHMTFLDGWLATGILVALAANVAWGWWWADAAAAAAVGVAAARESAELFTDAGHDRDGSGPSIADPA